MHTTAVHNAIGLALRSRFMPRRIGAWLWYSYALSATGSTYRVPVIVANRPVTYGGVFGLTTNELFQDLSAYDHEVFRVLQHRLIMPSPVVIDVGANNGQYLLGIKSRWPNARMVCIEPFCELASWLHELISVNRLEDVKVVNCVIGDSCGTLTLHYQDGFAHTASTVQDFYRFSGSRMVRSMTLDALIEAEKIDHIDLVKIDVEGGEREVLRGATQLLDVHRPDIILEILYTDNGGHLTRQSDVVQILQRARYRFFALLGNNIVAQMIPTPDPTYRFPNYLVVPEERSASVLTS